MRRKFHALKKPKVRQDWSKYNFYNLSRMVLPSAANKTYFQQKWLAKSLSRSYHGPHIREGIWSRMFDRRLPAVVPMDHRYLARKDGSEHASGRGSGGDVNAREARGKDKEREKKPEKTPYMQMAFHPMERRLDMAVWRALFASSTRQARQFVVHGWVKVNGKKMIYPGYQLNPGDMFSVDPERVLFATGAKKAKAGRPDSDEVEHGKDSGADTRASKRQPLNETDPDADEEDGLSASSTEPDSDAGAATLESAETRQAMTTKPEEETDPKKALKTLMMRAKKILDDSKRKLSGRRQQELRDFARSVKKTLSKHGQKGTGSSASDLETALAAITSKIPSDDLPAPEMGSAEAAEAADASANPQADRPDAYRARKDAELLSQALARAAENPVDANLPYATPWRPREYMSAFAFIPRYLEVNQNICSAVFLRSPVARPGLAEVPAPFHGETSSLAFNWYLRRR